MCTVKNNLIYLYLYKGPSHKGPAKNCFTSYCSSSVYIKWLRDTRIYTNVFNIHSHTQTHRKIQNPRSQVKVCLNRYRSFLVTSDSLVTFFEKLNILFKYFYQFLNFEPKLVTKDLLLNIEWKDSFQRNENRLTLQ